MERMQDSATGEDRQHDDTDAQPWERRFEGAHMRRRRYPKILFERTESGTTITKLRCLHPPRESVSAQPMR